MAEISTEVAPEFQGKMPEGTYDFVTSSEQTGHIAREERIGDVLTYGVPSVLAGMADTFGTSLGLLDENDVEKFLVDNYKSLGSYYARNKEPVKLIGDVTGMFIPGLAAEKAIRSGSYVAKTIERLTGKNSKLLNSVFTSGKNYDELLAEVRARDLYLAQRGEKKIGEDLLRRQVARKALATGVMDSVKRGVAFELGVAATMNSSDVLFPDEMSALELIGLNMAAPALLTGVETLFMRRLIRQSAMDVAPYAEKALNPEGVPFEDIIFRPGKRDVGITLYSAARDAAANAFKRAEAAAKETGTGDDLYFSNLNSEILQLSNEVKDQVSKLGRDKPIAGLTNSKPLDEAEIKAAMSAQEQDPTSLLGTLSIEKYNNIDDIDEFYKSKDRLVGRLDEQVTELAAKLDSDPTIPPERLQTLIDERDRMKGLELFVLEADGSISVARGRKEIFQDGPRDVKTMRANQNEPKYFVAKVGDETFSVTEDGIAVIPELKENKLAGVNVTEIFGDIEKGVAEIKQKESKLLFDIGKTYHFKTGQLGKPIHDQLPEAIQRQLDNWTGSSGASAIRGWVENQNEYYRVLYDAYEPLRMRLREIADQNGTITLYRGENAAENEWIKKFKAGDPTANASQINDVVSMTSSVDIAKKFARGSGGHIIAKRVHVDDVITVVGGLGDEFEFIVKGNRNRVFGDTISKRSFRALDLKRRSALYDAYQKAVESYRPKGRNTLILSENDHHTRIDYALELLNKPNGWKKGWDADAVAASIKLPKGVTTIEDLEFLSLSKKLEEFSVIQKMIEESNNPARRGLFDLAPDEKPTLDDIAKMLNLPGSGKSAPHPLMEVFAQIATLQGDDNLGLAVKNMDHLQRLMQENTLFPELMSYQGRQLATRGKMMDIPRDAKASLLVKRPLKSADYQRDVLFNMARDNYAMTQQILGTAGQSGGDLVQRVYDHMNNLESAQVAKGVDTLVEGQQRADNVFLQTQFAAGENPAMQAVNLVENLTDREAREVYGNYFRDYVDTFAQLRGNRASEEIFNIFVHARRQGWDLAEAPENIDGRWFFPLKTTEKGEHTTQNQERWRAMFGSDIPDEDVVYMPAPARKGQQYTPLAVDDLAMQSINAIQDLGSRVWSNTNVLRRAAGRRPLNYKEWWVPPKNFANQNIVMLVTPDGRVKSIMRGRTLGEAKRRAEAEVDASDEMLFMVDQQDANKYWHLHDQAMERMLDYSDIINQTGKAKGTSVGEVIDTGDAVLNDITESLTRQFESITRRTRALYFEPQVNYARHIYNVAGPESGRKGQSVWQHYIAAVYGNPTINPNEMVGKTYFALESVYDDLMNKLYDKKLAAIGLSREPGKAGRGQERAYKALDKQLGEYNPFQSAADYAARTYQVQPPPSMKPHMARLNQIASFLTLRMGEVGHAVLNLTSLAATTPAVIKSLAKQANESPEQWKARIAAFGTTLDEEGMAMFSPYRAATSAMHDIFSPQGREIIEEARKLGYFNQDVAELFKTITAPRQGYVENFLTKIADKLSIVSDKSEELSRGISFMIGHTIAKRGLGIEGKENAFAFAHNFANQVIGDYRPNNRPRIFQGAVGMPLGLFMTFTQNFYQRLFGYIENKQFAALATQYATQAAVFGGQSVPGFTQFSDWFASNYDGSVNPVDSIQSRFSPAVADTILYGALGNIPRLFGADTGIALYQRGDINLERLPGLWNIGETPGAQMISNAYNLITSTASMLKNNGGYNNQQMLEILGNYGQNRMIRNAATLFAGYAVDRRGAVVSDDVYSEMSIASRALGFKPIQEAKQAEAHYRTRASQLSQAAKMAELRNAFRANIRAGDTSDEDWEELFRNYLYYGGNPRSLPRFLKSQSMKALVDRDVLEFMKAMSDPTRMTDIKRILNSEVLSPNDPYLQGAR